MERYHSSTHKFIVIDGVDYAGKTSLTKLLENYDFTALKSPSNDPQGHEVTKRVFKEYCLKEESLRLFMENNRHISNVLCDKYSCKNVVLDRFYLSTAAYHSIFLDDDTVCAAILDDVTSGSVVRPHKYFILDVSLEERLHRAKNRDPDRMSSEKMDSLYLHEKVRAKFKWLASRLDYCVVLDGEKTQNELLEIIMRESKTENKAIPI